MSTVTVPWTPIVLGPAIWLDASDEFSYIEDVGGGIQTWQDKSGNGNHATQLSAGSMPTKLVAGLNGKSLVEFDGVDDFLSIQHAATMEFAAGVTAFYAIVPDNSGRVFAKKDEATGADDGDALFASPNTVFSIAGAFSVLSDPPLGQGLIQCGLWDGNTFCLYRNGAKIDVGSPAYGAAVDGCTNPNLDAFNNTDQLVLGKRVISGYSELLFLGKFAGVLFIQGAVSAADRQKIEGYYAHWWGLAGNLPADHPYKATAPTMEALVGNAKTSAGDPVDAVVIRRMDTRAHVKEIVPDGNGDWQAPLLAPGEYDITYFASGCQPINHGPYTVE